MVSTLNTNEDVKIALLTIWTHHMKYFHNLKSKRLRASRPSFAPINVTIALILMGLLTERQNSIKSLLATRNSAIIRKFKHLKASNHYWPL